MKSFYKYLIFFIIGIILSLFTFKKRIVEGLNDKICGISDTSLDCVDNQNNSLESSVEAQSRLGIRYSMQNNDQKLISSEQMICSADPTLGWGAADWGQGWYDFGYSSASSGIDKNYNFCTSQCISDTSDSPCKAVSFRMISSNYGAQINQYCKKWTESDLNTFFDEGGECKYRSYDGSNTWNFAINEDYFKNNICDHGQVIDQRNPPFMTGTPNEPNNYELFGGSVIHKEYGTTFYCRRCEDGEEPNSDKSECEPCSPRTAGTGGVCEQCPVNSNPNDEKTQCICDEGYYMQEERCVQLSEVQQNLVDKINNDNSLNRGCSNFICESDPNTYDRYEKRIYSSDEKPEIYDNCSNISPEEAQYHNPELNVCTKEICCENRTCLGIKEKLIEIGGENFCGDRTFIPNAYVSTSLGNELAIDNICCRDSNSEYNELFDRIIEFRNDKGGNISNGNNITGVDIRNYLYYSLLDLVAIDIANNPLTEDSRIEGTNIATSPIYISAHYRQSMPSGTVYRAISDQTQNKFKSGDDINIDDTVSQNDCIIVQSSVTGKDIDNGNITIKYPNYPQIGNKYANTIRIDTIGDNCDENSLKHVIQRYAWFDDSSILNYNDYELLSIWINSLNPNNIEDINKLILINELEVDTNLRNIDGLDNIFNIIDSSSSEITKDSIKRYIINLTKEININNTSAKTTPLDRFFHTSINNYNNSLINKNIFSGLLNQ